MKMKAVGDKGVPEADRIFLQTYLPRGGSVKSQAVFFSRVREYLFVYLKGNDTPWLDDGTSCMVSMLVSMSVGFLINNLLQQITQECFVPEASNFVGR